MWFSLAFGLGLGLGLASAQDVAGPDDLLHLARERARDGDYEGARLVAGEAAAVEGPHQRTATYLVALSWELSGELDRALAMYDALLVDRPDDEDVRFRRAECLGKLGRYAEARDALAGLGLTGRPEADRLKMSLLEATWDLELGRDRPALRRIDRELARADASSAPWYQGLARHAILVHATATAEALVFEGSDGRKRRALEQRAALIALAEQELAALVRLDSDATELTLDGFARLARTYEDLGDDLLAEPPLEKLTEDQRRINRALLLERVQKVWVKGTLYYDRGLELAATRDWTGEPVPTMHAAYDQLVARVDGMAIPSPGAPAGVEETP
jgi:hypothetical protein